MPYLMLNVKLVDLEQGNSIKKKEMFTNEFNTLEC